MAVSMLSGSYSYLVLSRSIGQATTKAINNNLLVQSQRAWTELGNEYKRNLILKRRRFFPMTQSIYWRRGSTSSFSGPSGSVTESYNVVSGGFWRRYNSSSFTPISYSISASGWHASGAISLSHGGYTPNNSFISESLETTPSPMPWYGRNVISDGFIGLFHHSGSDASGSEASHHGTASLSWRGKYITSSVFTHSAVFPHFTSSIEPARPTWLMRQIASNYNPFITESFQQWDYNPNLAATQSSNPNQRYYPGLILVPSGSSGSETWHVDSMSFQVSKSRNYFSTASAPPSDKTDLRYRFNAVSGGEFTWSNATFGTDSAPHTIAFEGSNYKVSSSVYRAYWKFAQTEAFFEKHAVSASTSASKTVMKGILSADSISYYESRLNSYPPVL